MDTTMDGFASGCELVCLADGFDSWQLDQTLLQASKMSFKHKISVIAKDCEINGIFKV
jgi:hypothetical protein